MNEEKSAPGQTPEPSDEEECNGHKLRDSHGGVDDESGDQPSLFQLNPRLTHAETENPAHHCSWNILILSGASKPLEI